ncbi:MAG: hypothetical protein ACKON8_11380, partial [Planctomycetota bacterium]
MTAVDLSRVNAEPAPERLAFAIHEIARQAPDRIAVVAAAGSPQRQAIGYGALAAAVAAVERT